MLEVLSVSAGVRTDVMWELGVYINASKEILSPYGNKLWLLELSKDWIKQIRDGQGELRYYRLVSNRKFHGDKTGLFRGSHLRQGERDIPSTFFALR
jgi:hypothetical protein